MNAPKPHGPAQTSPQNNAGNAQSARASTDERPGTHRYKRGDIWMVASDPDRPPIGNEIWSNRPALVVSNNILNTRSGFAQVVYLSTSSRKRSTPTHVLLTSPDGRGETMALCEQVHTVDASRMLRRMGDIPPARQKDIDAALTLSLSIGRNPDTFSAFRKWEEHVKLNGIDIAAEISALSGHTTDQRVESLTRALEIVTGQRDAYRTLYESSQELPETMREAVIASVEKELQKTV